MALWNKNKWLNLPELQKIMMHFEQESDIMDWQEETISDTIDDVISGEDDEVGAHCLKEPMTWVRVHISGLRLEV